MNPFKNQYHLTYLYRLNYLKPFIYEECIDKFKLNPLNEIYLLSENNIKNCIIGILYIKSDLKPSLFNTITQTNTYFSLKNKYYLEDGSRIELKINEKILEKYFLATGMAVGLLGKIKNGIFNVEDVCFAGNKRFIECDKVDSYNIIDGKIAFFSHLLIKKDQNYQNLILILEFLKKKNLISCFIGPLFYNEFDFDILNQILNLCKSKILIPSSEDPSTKILPYKPIHKKLLPNNTISLGSPCYIKSNDKLILILDGSSIEDILKYQNTNETQTNQEKCIKIVEIEENLSEEEDFNLFNNNNIIYTKERTQLFLDAIVILNESRYIYPTAPDTLKSEPILEKDPFIIYEKVDIFVVFNAPESCIKRFESFVVVLISKFSEKCECLIFDFENLDFEIIEMK